jgi:hypothetical protein
VFICTSRTTSPYNRGEESAALDAFAGLRASRRADGDVIREAEVAKAIIGRACVKTLQAHFERYIFSHVR